ncbi:MAG: NAD(P)-dependent oxidoreductase [Rhodobacteraceae bacterium]|nr:NAD(P)-dependent oxidoreductase [Paracoccaceae bacterium]
MTDKVTVGFIGLGKMGRGMALNLAKAGYPLVVFDAFASAMEPLIAAGAQAAGSPADVAAWADVIFTSLPGPVEFEAVVNGPDGLLSALSPGQAHFDLSTNDLGLIRRIETAYAAKGAALLDAPISGGPAGAASGDLVVWVGGDKAVYDRFEPVIAAFAKSPRHVGVLGAGAITKLAHNMLGYMIMQAEAEIFSLATKAGVDPLDLWEGLRLGLVGKGSPLDMLVKQFLPGQFETPAMALKLAFKDVTLATALGRELGVPMRMAAMTHADMVEAIARGMGEWDSRSFMKLQVDRAGVSIAVPQDRLDAAVARAKR